MGLDAYSNDELITELTNRGYELIHTGPYCEAELTRGKYSKRADENGERLKKYKGTALIPPDVKVI